MKKILMITGVLPPAACGVGDYTKNILDTEGSKSWFAYTAGDWRLHRLLKILREINKIAPDIIFLQYPAEGYGWSLVPHMLLLYFKYIKKTTFITVLHEYSSLSQKSRFFIKYILSRSTKLIFTTNFELNNLSMERPNILPKSFVVPILSNIPAPKKIKAISNRSIDILYFGHIRPNKGLEDYLRVANQLLSKSSHIRIKLVGQVPKGYEIYLDTLKKIFPGFLKLTLLNADIESVLDALGDAKICFLPFPDGISERRGSFLAATQNGAIVASYPGRWQTYKLKQAFVPLERGNESEELMRLLLNSDLLIDLQNKSIEYHSQANFVSWDDIAREYFRIAFASPIP